MFRIVCCIYVSIYYYNFIFPRLLFARFRLIGAASRNFIASVPEDAPISLTNPSFLVNPVLFCIFLLYVLLFGCLVSLAPGLNCHPAFAL